MDGADSSFAIDGDPSTCSETGRETVAWFKVDLGQVRNVTAIYMKGGSAQEVVVSPKATLINNMLE